ncbi:DUF645 family protein, partial [Vibrio cholerae]|nr:DUF645 family protein [Vibrio cholerae]
TSQLLALDVCLSDAFT